MCTAGYKLPRFPKDDLSLTQNNWGLGASDDAIHTECIRCIILLQLAELSFSRFKSSTGKGENDFVSVRIKSQSCSNQSGFELITKIIVDPEPWVTRTVKSTACTE